MQTHFPMNWTLMTSFCSLPTRTLRSPSPDPSTIRETSSRIQKLQHVATPSTPSLLAYTLRLIQVYGGNLPFIPNLQLPSSSAAAATRDTSEHTAAIDVQRWELRSPTNTPTFPASPSSATRALHHGHATSNRYSFSRPPLPSPPFPGC